MHTLGIIGVLDLLHNQHELVHSTSFDEHRESAL